MITGTQETIDGRPALRFERRLPHAVDRVWRAVTEPSELVRWFVAPVAWEPRLGESAEVFGQHFEITELDPPRVITWVWGGERYSFELAPDGDGCALVFTHVFNPELGPAAQHAAGWETYFARLDAVLGGGALSEEEAHQPVGELHELYVARFGSDPAPGRRMVASMLFRGLTLEDGPTLRLERRYRHSIDRVWRALNEEREHWFPSGEPLQVTANEPSHLLAGTWFGDELSFELRGDGDGDGCVLVFTQAFDDRDTAARTAAGWDRCFARVDALLAGHPLDEVASLELWADVHERYAEAFGVDPELGRQAFAQHPLT